MKRRCLIVLVILLLMLLRETGIVGLNFHLGKPDGTYTSETVFHETEALQLRFEEDNGKPFIAKILKPDDTYNVVVRYRFDESLSWTRWIPLWKSGNNAVQLLYDVWLGNQLAGSGYITLSGSQTIFGLCSAREYRDLLRVPIFEEMRRQVSKKVHIFSRPPKTI